MFKIYSHKINKVKNTYQLSHENNISKKRMSCTKMVCN